MQPSTQRAASRPQSTAIVTLAHSSHMSQIIAYSLLPIMIHAYPHRSLTHDILTNPPNLFFTPPHHVVLGASSSSRAKSLYKLG